MCALVLRAAALLVCALALSTVQAQAPLLTLEPPDLGTSALFGASVAAVPDTDGDGRADLLVGAYLTTVNGVSTVGRAHLYSGGTGGLLRTLDSPNPRRDGHFGFSVAGVPDADGDGRGDFLVGAYGELVGAVNSGRAYLFSGATGALLRPLASPDGRYSGEFGASVAGLADVDGDGRGDVLVGARDERIGAAGAAGRAYVFSGITGTLLHTLTRPTVQGNAFFGDVVAAVPDADGDGKDDLVVASSRDDVPLRNMGRAYLFSGATGAFLRTLDSPGPEVSGEFGYSAAGVPDLNGDGRGEVLIGAPDEDGGATDAGRVYVFSGSDGTLLRTLFSPTLEEFGIFGEAVAGVPDVDGDGVGDLLIGAPLEDGGRLDAGRVHLFSGASGALLGSLQSPNPRTYPGLGNFGLSVAGVPDVDGDGRGDLLAGSSHEYGGPPVTGRAYLFSGLAVATDSDPPAPDGALDLRAAPNPARGATTLSFTLDRSGPVRLAVFDALGREVAVLVDGARPAGRHEARVDAGRLAPGVYLARLTSEGTSVSRVIAVVR